MKKLLANIRTLAALLIASATLAACTNDDGIIDDAQPAQQGPQVYTLTLHGDETRALALDGSGNLEASWANGDEVTVTKGTTTLGTLTAKDASGATCTFSGTLSGTIAADDVLTLTYHPQSGLSAFGSQAGTLESAADYDMATATVTVESESGGDITIKEAAASFTTQTAMLKITMKDAGDKALNATSLKISAAGADIFTFSPTDATYSANGDGILYVALPSATTVAVATGLTTAVLASTPITFTATV